MHGNILLPTHIALIHIPIVTWITTNLITFDDKNCDMGSDVYRLALLRALFSTK